MNIMNTIWLRYPCWFVLVIIFTTIFIIMTFIIPIALHCPTQTLQIVQLIIFKFNIIDQDLAMAEDFINIEFKMPEVSQTDIILAIMIFIFMIIFIFMMIFVIVVLIINIVRLRISSRTSAVSLTTTLRRR